MTPTQAPAKPLELSSEDLAKVQRARARDEGQRLEPEWSFVAEFGYYYGWQGVSAILNNEISFAVANQLMKGARKIRYSKVVDYAVATQTANVAANSKHAKSVMNKGLKHFIKEAK